MDINENKNNKRNKKYLTISAIILIILIVVGATFAYFNSAFKAKNSNVNTGTPCFNIINTFSSEASDNILFPVASPKSGKKVNISLKVDQACQNVSGTGSLYLHINSGTSNQLFRVSAAHCENKKTLETMDDYKNSTDCQNASNGKWVTDGTPIKYAVYDNADGNGIPLKVGYLKTSDIGTRKLLYDGIDVNYTNKNFYVFVWMDGYITDESYTNLPFDGYIDVSVVQK